MKLRKKDRIRLEGILEKLQRGHSFLMQNNILVCSRKSNKTTSLDFINDQEEICVEINKECGSELCLLESGIHLLNKALEESN